MSTPLFGTAAPSAEFYFNHDGVDYTAFPSGWEENGCDVFDLEETDSGQFVAGLHVSPFEDVADAFDRWRRL
jgi:hypothetical protein